MIYGEDNSICYTMKRANSDPALSLKVLDKLLVGLPQVKPIDKPIGKSSKVGNEQVCGPETEFTEPEQTCKTKEKLPMISRPAKLHSQTTRPSWNDLSDETDSDPDVEDYITVWSNSQSAWSKNESDDQKESEDESKDNSHSEDGLGGHCGWATPESSDDENYGVQERWSKSASSVDRWSKFTTNDEFVDETGGGYSLEDETRVVAPKKPGLVQTASGASSVGMPQTSPSYSGLHAPPPGVWAVPPTSETHGVWSHGCGGSSQSRYPMEFGMPEISVGALGYSGMTGNRAEWINVCTVMMKNLPNKITHELLVSELRTAGFDDTYDFIYVPMDPSTNANRGYAFINFVNEGTTLSFKDHFEGKKLEGYNSYKFISVVPATMQGFDANIGGKYSKPSSESSDTSRSRRRNRGTRPESLIDIAAAAKQLQEVGQAAAKQQEAEQEPTVVGSAQKDATMDPATDTQTDADETKLAEEHVATEATTLPEKKFCPYCGGRCQGDFKFCLFCGASIPSVAKLMA